MNREREERRAAKYAAKAHRKAERRVARGEKKRATAEAHMGLVSAGEPVTPAARGLDVCTCTKDCDLHGDCLRCVAYHASRSERPRCER